MLCVGKELGGIFGRGRADGGVGVGVGSVTFHWAILLLSERMTPDCRSRTQS